MKREKKKKGEGNRSSEELSDDELEDRDWLKKKEEEKTNEYTECSVDEYNIYK